MASVNISVLARFGDHRLPDEFWKRVQPTTDGCWIWVGSCNATTGYSVFFIKRKPHLGHRFSYSSLIGEIKSETIDHLCRNRACVNPCHLEPVSNKENVLRGAGITAVNATKRECCRGHALSGPNVRIAPDGSRVCLTCRSLWSKRYALQRKRARHSARPEILRWKQRSDSITDAIMTELDRRAAARKESK